MIRRVPRRYQLFVLLLIIFAFIVPLPYVLVEPGIPNDTFSKVKGKPILDIIGRETFPTTGKLNITSIWVTSPDSHIQSLELIRGWIDGERSVQPREVFYPEGTNIQKVTEENVAEMKNSQLSAQVAALNYLKIPFQTRFIVKGLRDDSPNKKVIETGDQLASFDGININSLSQFKKLITASQKKVVDLGVIRDGKSIAVPVTLRVDESNTASAGKQDTKVVNPKAKNAIGVFVTEDYTFPFEVKIRLKDIGGPSAGLIFTLSIIDKLTREDLVNGRNIAGTGTISPDGKVGPIGGIEEKLIGAAREGATLFLAPALNCSDIQHAPRSLRVVPVDTLAEAIAALREKDPERLPLCG